MSVIIRVGLDHDHILPEPPQNGMGILHVGLNGLLQYLEGQLGLEQPKVSYTIRMVQYLGCLKARDEEDRFFHASFQVDDLGVARQLLQWRDIWYEAGWNGDEFQQEAPPRLRDMAEVEMLAHDTVALGRGQRVQRVLCALHGDRLDIKIESVDPLKSYSQVWRELLTRLDATFVEAHYPDANPGTDLQRLQRCLAGESTATSGNKLQLSGDGSVVVIHADSPHLSAPWVTRYAHLIVKQKGDYAVGILAPGRGEVLDDALAEAGFARLGFSSLSIWRPISQVLPLAMELLWKPLDPRALLQFLTHSFGPIPYAVRNSLAKAVSEQPGIGGEKWNEQLEKVLEEQQHAGREEEDLNKVRAAINFWLLNERYAPTPGAPVDSVRKRTQKTREWLQAVMSVQEEDVTRTLFNTALAQTDELLGALDRLEGNGVATISREVLQRLIASTRGSGAGRPDRQAERIPGEQQLLRADKPSGFIDHVPVVVWWGCDKETVSGVYPWSRSEQNHLRASGIQLQPVDEKLKWQSGSWLRPILSATEQLVLIFHDDAESHHPIWDRISTIAQGWLALDLRPPAELRLSVADLIEQPKSEPLTVRPLPGFTRWWQLPDGDRLSKRNAESYSSLEKFLFGPYQWALKYKAQLSKGALAEVTDGNLLKGNLAHMLFERFFALHPNPTTTTASEVQRWSLIALPLLIEQTGAMLLVPGRQYERESFISSTMRALGILLSQLQRANVVQVQMEQWKEGRFIGGYLNGAIDLVARNSDDRVALIDIKWGGFRYRKQSLVDSNYLQLGTYAELYRQSSGSWPSLGYFIIDDARLLAMDRSYFADAEVYRPENGESVAEYWQRVQQTWKWRRAQLDEGLIEVSVTGTEPDDFRSSPGEWGLAMPESYDSFDDYAVLTGWKEGV